jgi:hypothetical protein
MGTAKFFLNEWAQRAYFIDKEEGNKPGSSQRKTTTETTRKNRVSTAYGNYTRAVRPADSFAPAAIHRETSLFNFAMTVGTNDSRRLKTLLFLSSQISQRISKARERVAFRGISGVVVMFVHH